MEIDEIDRQILQILEEDPRISNRKISDLVGLTPQAVGIRIKKMRDARIIGGIKILKPLPQPSKAVRKIERFKTNIPGLDRYIGGGFPNPSTVLLAGESGAGTTVFCLKLLWSALNEGLKCAFFAIERPAEQVKQQLERFGWDTSQSANIEFIDVYKLISDHLREFETISHIDALQIQRKMLEKQRTIMSDADILFFDNMTELLKLAKGSSVELELVNQLGTTIMKNRRDKIYFCVIKPHFTTENALLTMKSYSDCVIQFRYVQKNQRFHRFMLIEKMLFTEHTSSEIEFHITNNGIILNEYMLQHQALLNPIEPKHTALFQIKELDYLTQGLNHGTTWLFEINSLFPLSDLVKLYALFFTDGIERQNTCRFGIPNFLPIMVSQIFGESIHSNKSLRKNEVELIDLITSNQLTLYDFFHRSETMEVGLDENIFEPVMWSQNPEKNLSKLGTLFTIPSEKHTYFGVILSELVDLPIRLTEDHLSWLYEYLVKMNQKQGDVLLATINPSLHQSRLINRLEYISDGIVKLWVDTDGQYIQEKYIQVTKTPQGKPSMLHQIIFGEKPPYVQVI